MLLTSSKCLFDIWQETSYRRIADEQTLLKIYRSLSLTHTLTMVAMWRHQIFMLR